MTSDQLPVTSHQSSLSTLSLAFETSLSSFRDNQNPSTPITSSTTMEIFNGDGVVSRRGLYGRFYCGRPLLTCRCCDVNCGPNVGCCCNSCAEAQTIRCPQNHPLIICSLLSRWVCDAKKEPGGCRRRPKIFSSLASGAVARFRCNVCDYNICEECFAHRVVDAHPSARCPKKHLLRLSRRENAWTCDRCGDCSLEANDRYRCDRCDYDLCSTCYVLHERGLQSMMLSKASDEKLRPSSPRRVYPTAPSVIPPNVSSSSISQKEKRLAEEVERLKASKEKMEEENQCAICLTETKNTAFDCGHLACSICAAQIVDCHICRRRIASRIRIYR